MDQPLMVTDVPRFAALSGPLSSERGKPGVDVQGWEGLRLTPTCLGSMCKQENTLVLARLRALCCPRLGPEPGRTH